MTESEAKIVKLLYELTRVLLDNTSERSHSSFHCDLREVVRGMEKEFDESVLGVEKWIED